MSNYDFDLFVLGAGSGGVRASRVASSLGARVAVAEEAALGGTCVNVGCIPKKLMVYAAHFALEREEAVGGYGWTVEEGCFDWATLIANKDREIARLVGVYGDLLDASGVERIEGRAALSGPHGVRVGDRSYSAQHILVATGGRPVVPELPGSLHAITSNEVFSLPEMPQRILIVGGGYIAVEFAGIFSGLGADVVQLYRGPLFLRGFDDDVRAHLSSEMRERGIDLRFDVNVQAIEKHASGVRAALTDGSELDADVLMFATGRAPNSRGLGLEEAGVALDAKGAIPVDAYSRTRVPSIFAIGDVTNRIALTPVAIHEGICMAHTLFGDEPRRPDHEDVPSAVFSQPPLASVGLTEAQARERFPAIDVYRSDFRPLKQTLTGSAERSLMKLLVDRESDRVVGVHVVGPEAGEIIQGFAVALKCRATKAQFDATLGVHPTSAEELVTLRTPVVSGDVP